uniref:Trafficking protein particle complex subunit 8 n=1 Tax=Clastoptera arizonana TaxID=38151 RepID=A0A1B6D9P4_9HEMI
MALNKITPQEFIQNSFSPVIGSFCSPLVEKTCKKNNLTFTEMIQPFCKLTAEANFRDPSSTLVVIKNFRIVVSDIHLRPPQPTMARKFLNESVSSVNCERTSVVQVGDMNLDIPVSVPWFEAWRDTFLQVQFPSDHEFIKHYLACVLVVSSQELSPMDNFIQMISQLQQMQNISPSKLPKWFSSSVLKYYVLLHDNIEGNLSAANTTFELMKNTYGVNNCFFLNINSQTAPSNSNEVPQPDPWAQFISKQVYSQDINEADINMVDGRNHLDGLGGVEAAQEAGETPSTPVVLHPLSPVTEQHHLLAVNSSHENLITDSIPNTCIVHGAHLTSTDLDRIRQFINDFCIRCLIPHAESQIQHLTDMIANKKGVSRSLLSATKRWFGSNKPGLPNSPTPTVMYTSDSPELQLRRLGDLCFMFGAYSLAFTAYHGAKRDFNADSAWLHYAGALEMAALSLFMQGGETSRKAHEYAEESILSYLNACRMPQFATRATLFSAECLKARSLYGEAAKQLIRMTSEDSDLRSALLLEQAAYCFLSSVRPQMPRKYAFHLVLAGHRFSKAGQRKHSLRCYRQAYQVYENKSWCLAEDHIHHTIGRQASYLKLTSEATEAFSKLLPRASRQAATQQSTFLREYLTAQQQLNQETGELPILPLPIVDNESIQVLIGNFKHQTNQNSNNAQVPASGITFDFDNSNQTRWLKVEEQLVNFSNGSQSSVFKPTVELLTNFTNNTSCPIAYVSEPVLVSVNLNNPLHISIPLHQVHLLWSFIPKNDGLCQDNTNDTQSPIATSQVIESIVLSPDTTSKVVLQVTPHEIGELRITGLAYNLAGDSNGLVAVKGRQLLIARGPKLRPAKDKKPDEGPVYAIDNRLRLNVKESAPCLKVSFEGLRKDMLCGELLHITVHLENIGTLPVSRVLLGSPTPGLFSVGKHQGEVAVLPLSKPLTPGQKTQLPMQIRAPDIKGQSMLEFMFYYDSQHGLTNSVYRLVRHSWPLSVYESLQVTATATRSSSISSYEELLNLKIQVQNINQLNDPVVSEISILCLSLYSTHWELSSHAYFPPNTKLQAQELAHLMVQALRKDRLQPHLSCIALDKDFQLSPSQDFLSSTVTNVMNSTTDSVISNLQAALMLQATFIVMWKGHIIEDKNKTKRIAFGQHHLKLEKIGESTSWPPLTMNNPIPITLASSLKIFGDTSINEDVQTNNLFLKQQLLIVKINCKLTLTHDFAVERLCIVPVDLVVQNCSDCDLIAKVETMGKTFPASTNARAQLFSPHSCNWFYWVGFSRRVVSLRPHSSTTIHLSAATAAPGAYDLSSHLLVHAKHLNDSEFVPQSWRSDAVLIVT